jgi:HSP20 family protein
MILTRWNPFRELERMHREMDRLFDGETSDGCCDAFACHPLATARRSRSFPLVNVREDADAYRVEALAPGIDPKALKVSVTGKQLLIEGERTVADADVPSENYSRVERAGGRFVRSLTLPTELDPDAVKADYRNGILSIVLPKAASARPRLIAVNAN